MHHPLIQAIFPYIEFISRADARILLVSLHKIFYGFFDGQRKINGTHLKNYIIFADEFDFLEKDLVGLIARARQINDPFAFVDTFYRELSRHKWPLEAYPVADKEAGTIRKRLDGIRNQVEEIQKSGGT